MEEKIIRDILGAMQCVLCGKRTFSTVMPQYHGRRLGRCLACGLVQVIPMPGPKEIRGLYHEDMDHFEPYIAQLPVHREYFHKKVREIKRKGTLLDIGCAMGVLLEEAEKIGLTAQGVDISKDAVAYCKKRGLRVSQSWPKAMFDVITAFEIIEHERDPMHMMRRVYSLLNNNGMVVMTTPNHSSIWRKLMGKWWVGYHHPEHVTFWDTKSLSTLMRKAGLKNITVARDTPRPFPLSFVFRRGADYFPWAGSVLRPIGKFLDRWHLRNPINPWDDLIVTGRKLS